MKKFSNPMLLWAICALCGILAAGLTKAAERDTPERDGRFVVATAGAAIQAGHMVGILPADGEAYPAADTATLAIVGRAENTVAEGGRVTIRRGVFRWSNLGEFDAGDIGQTCYVSNSVGVTTAAIAANEVAAGVIQDVDSSGVWVDTYNTTLQLTSQVAALTVTGNEAVGGTLTVTGATALNGGLTMDSNKFTVADTSGNTLIAGTLAVTGVTTLTAAPKLTALTAAAAVTATATNAPALAAAAAPKWVTVTIGTDTCVIPAYVLQ